MTGRLSRWIAAAVIFVMSFCICISSQTMNVSADSGTVSFSFAGRVTVYDGDYCSMYMGSRLDGASKVTVTSSKNSVIKVYSYDDKRDNGYISFDANKTGSATVTVRVRKNGDVRTYTTAVESVKYSNPFRSFSIGGNNVRSIFNKNPNGQYENTMRGWKKISIDEARDWELVKITHRSYNKKTEKYDYTAMKNGKADLSGEFYYDDILYVRVRNSDVYNGAVRTFILYL